MARSALDGFRPQHGRAIPHIGAHGAALFGFKNDWIEAESFDARLSQNAIAEPPGIVLGVNRHPHFLAGSKLLTALERLLVSVNFVSWNQTSPG